MCFMLVSITSLFLFLFSSTLALPQVQQSPHNGTTPTKQLSSNGTFAITGINDGGIYPRLEIRGLERNQDQWNLFLLAMQSFQHMDANQLQSFFQIAGIHGLPSRPWDGVQADQVAMTQGAVGYCLHGSPLFLVWHRPYVAVFEQVLHQNIMDIVNSFPEGSARNRYASAAKGIRMPYWDWAAIPQSGDVLPASITVPTVSVDTPTGQRNISNPLYRFDAVALNSEMFGGQPWDDWSGTLRYPDSFDAQATSQNTFAADAIANSAVSIRDSVYQMFTNCSDYLEVSDASAKSSSPGCATSLEAIHNSIHTLTGGIAAGGNGGHMADTWHAGFDPLFFLHHANVDRLFALWQAVHPDSFMPDANSSYPTFTMPANSQIDGNTPLTPFHRDSKGTFWTANSVRNVETFHYTYPELSSSNLMATINQLYGNGNDSPSSKRRDVGLLSEVANLTSLLPPNLGHLAPDLASLLTPTGRRHDYMANILSQHMGLNGSYNIFIFLGQPINNESKWLVDSNLVGSHGVFSAQGMQSKMNNDVLVSGIVPLTSALVGRVADKKLASLEESDVLPYLAQNLMWKVVQSDGCVIDNAQVPGLEVSVVSADVVPAANCEGFPTWSQSRTLGGATQGKAGGKQS